MANIMMAPPQPPPCVALADDGGLKRVRFRLWYVLVTMLTILVAAWSCTLGPIPAIIALVIAKHVLVAILVMGLGVDRTRLPEGVKPRLGLD